MRIIPAVDILDHRVVQLVGGVPGTEQVTLPDPLTVARDWESKGAKRLHIIDLDSALGKGHNAQVIRSIIERSNVPVQVGGGIRSTEVAEYFLDCGADRVIAGTKGLKDPAWLRTMSLKYPKRMVLALDMKGGKIQTHGWKEDSPLDLKEVFTSVSDLPLAGVLFTNVDVEGQAKGIDVQAVRDFITSCPHLTIVSGGVTDQRDVDALEGMGVEEAVVGLSLYTGKLNHKAIWR